MAAQDIYCVVCLMTNNAVRVRTIVNGHGLCADHGKAAVRLATTDRWLHDVVNVTANMRATTRSDETPITGNEDSVLTALAAGRIDRILWNNRDENDIDEIVIHDATLHIEQMSDRCWWIGIDTPTGSWMGNFTCDSRGRMSFSEQENAGIEWADDDAHKAAI